MRVFDFVEAGDAWRDRRLGPLDRVELPSRRFDPSWLRRIRHRERVLFRSRSLRLGADNRRRNTDRSTRRAAPRKSLRSARLYGRSMVKKIHTAGEALAGGSAIAISVPIHPRCTVGAMKALVFSMILNV